MQRNKSGELRFDSTEIQEKNVNGYLFFIESGYLYTDDGTPITAWKNLSKDVPQFDTNCFGLTFADGKYWIDDNVQKIIDGDSYKQVDEKDIKIGDVELYTNDELGIIHADTVSAITENKFLFFKWKTIMVRTLSGTETEPYEAYLHDGPTFDVKIYCQAPEYYYRKQSEE